MSTSVLVGVRIYSLLCTNINVTNANFVAHSISLYKISNICATVLAVMPIKKCKTSTDGGYAMLWPLKRAPLFQANADRASRDRTNRLESGTTCSEPLHITF